MNYMLGEIKLFPFDDVPEGWLKCRGQTLSINKYPKLYMLFGTKFGKEGELCFKLPNLIDDEPNNLTYCIAVEGELPKLYSER